jgi:hypothetical protein
MHLSQYTVCKYILNYYFYLRTSHVIAGQTSGNKQNIQIRFTGMPCGTQVT